MEKIRGKESLFYIKKNNVWFPVSCLTSSPITEDVEMIETTTRQNEGWKSSFPTNQSYSISISGLVIRDDEDSNSEILSYRELRKMKRNKELIEWKRKTLAGYYVDKGFAYITSISDNDEAEGFISFQATLQGYGSPNEDHERIYILGNSDNDIYLHKDGNTIIQTKE